MCMFFLLAIRVYMSIGLTNFHAETSTAFLFDVCLRLQKLLALNRCANFYEIRTLRFLYKVLLALSYTT